MKKVPMPSMKKEKTSAAAKASAKPQSAAALASVTTQVRPLARRDGTGHLDSTYAADLHARSLASAEDHTVDRAFLRRSKTLRDPLAEELGREAVMTMTTAEDQSDQLQDLELELGEEVGGPFVMTTGGEEFAQGDDRSNPRGATQEPFPRT